ncbi:MAG: adenosylcobinamide-GDP ribazoletransferase [Thiothrix sp.]|nr:MAG: adenosylcobinamide-GDP ribazoletransferase [Thiothrix sp.]
MKQYRTAFFLAVSLLTRIPVNLARLSDADFGRSTLFYPLVGLLIGFILCVPVWLFPQADPLVLAAIITVLWAGLTGGLHLDGVADSADAWLGGLGDIEKTHRILKDPLVGAAGAIALVAVLLLKFAALTVVIKHQWFGVMLVAPALGRSLVLVLFLTTEYVRASGLASAAVKTLPEKPAFWLTLSVLGIAGLLAWQGLVLVLISFWLLRRLMLQRLGGCTGDTAGACVEFGEAAWLIGIALSL